MAVDLSPIDENLLATISGLHGMPNGAFNIRRNGELVQRSSSAFIDIETKDDLPGIDIRIKDGTRGETVYIPVIMSQVEMNDVVYNTFYVGEGCDVTIVAGCGIHNSAHQTSQHDGIHEFFVGRGSRIKYEEVHYGEGDPDATRILNPVTEVHLGENAFCEMNMSQLEGVTSTKRETNVDLAEGAKLILAEKMMTTDEQWAESNMRFEMNGEGSSVQVISRSVAKDDSRQVFSPLVVGSAACRGHVQCDSILMGNGQVKSIPAIEARSPEAILMHEAAIGKIAGEQIVKLQTLGLTEEEAEQEILDDFLS